MQFFGVVAGFGSWFKGCLVGLKLRLKILEHPLLSALEDEAHILESGDFTEFGRLFQIGFNAFERALHEFRKQLFQKSPAMLVIKLFQRGRRPRVRQFALARVLHQKINFAFEVRGDALEFERNTVAPAAANRSPKMEMLLVMIMIEENVQIRLGGGRR